MSAVLASASPRRIKASHRRRRKVTAGHFVQRYYDPQIGGFLSVDPAKVNTTTAANFGRYYYANDNPYRFTDPDGRKTQEGEAEREKAKARREAYEQRQRVRNSEMVITMPQSGSSATPTAKQPKTSVTPSSQIGIPATAGGISIEVSTINPWTSGGGGTYGLNLEYTKSNGWGLFTYNTPNKTPSSGFLVGPSVQMNVATGTGDWSGPFDSGAGSFGPITGGSFVSSPGAGETAGYFGFSLGLGKGPPGVGTTTTNYVQVW